MPVVGTLQFEPPPEEEAPPNDVDEMIDDSLQFEQEQEQEAPPDDDDAMIAAELRSEQEQQEQQDQETPELETGDAHFHCTEVSRLGSRPI